jgi:hypothetical protein
MPIPLAVGGKSRNSTYLPKTDIASLESGSKPVFVQKLDETVNSLDSVPTFELRHRQVGDRRFEVDAAVRALMIVVGHEFPQYALGMAFAANEHPVQALGPGCEHEAFGERVRPGRSEGCLDDLGTDRSHHLVKGKGLWSGGPVRDRADEGLYGPLSPRRSRRAAALAHDAQVAPARFSRANRRTRSTTPSSRALGPERLRFG